MVKTTTKQKIALVLFGILLFLILLEIFLRVSGFILLAVQRSQNKMGLASGSQREYRILALGESTTAHSQWPSLLELILNNRSNDYKFKVFNEGIPATNTAFILARLHDNLNEYEPDMVISMMGVNDRYISFKYDETFRTKLFLLVEDIRIYKLCRLIWRAWEVKLSGRNFNEKEAKNEFFFMPIELSKKPQKDREYTVKGFEHYEKGRYKEAEISFEKAVESNPEDYIAYDGLGRVYLELGLLDKAEKMFIKSIDINSEYEPAYIFLGNLYKQKGMYDKAEEMFKKAIAINPNNYLSYLFAGKNYHEMRMFKEAKAAFNKSLELNPNNGEAYAFLGDIFFLFLEKDLNKAEEMFKKAIELEEPDAKKDRIYFELGLLYLEKGELEQAEIHLKKAIEIEPMCDTYYYL